MAFGKKPGLAVGIMIGKPKPGLGGLPSVEKKGQPPAQDPDQDEDQDQQQGGSVGPEDVDYSDNDLCDTCKNMGQDGNCTKYGFQVEPTGHCEAGYEPQDGGAEGAEPISTGDEGGDQNGGDQGYGG